MRRIRELIADIKDRYRNDDFFTNFDETFQNWPPKRIYYETYGRVLRILDNDSWHILKEKALSHFLDHREGQRKQAFFNILNEAFAYRYLVSRRFENVRFIKEERNRRNPDITFKVNNNIRYCEVKTKNISNSEINLRTVNFVVRDSYDCYVELSDRFFYNFIYIVNKAKK
jgi:hypothetical protein